MSLSSVQELIGRYYAAFNAGDLPAMLDLLSEKVVHEVNQGEVRLGRAAFREFCTGMNRHYRERLSDIAIMASEDGRRAAAEFWVDGEYLTAPAGSPPAHGQRYQLRAGAFFEIESGKIMRVTTYYNAADWTRQVTEPAR
jgi:steroid delta-isomerase-like uncharacterized protein